MLEHKEWGIAFEVLSNDLVYVSGFTMIAGGKSSIHYHEELDNIFCVTSGSLYVEMWDGPPGPGGAPVRRYTVNLHTGERYAVAAGVYHRMGSDVGCSGIEVYERTRAARPNPKIDILRY